jgi:hypothetical protein
MTTSPSTPSAFISKDTIPVTLNKQTIYVYPKLDESMSESEKTFGFTTTMNALAAATSVPIKTRLETLGQLTGSSDTIQVYSRKYLNHAENWIKQVENLKMVSYHGKNGRLIQQTTDPVTGHLLAAIDANIGDRRKANIQFVKVRTMIDFSSINPKNTISRLFAFVIMLNMETREVNNAAGNRPAELTTFFGADGWLHNGDQEAFTAIFEHPECVRAPFDLDPPTINDVNIDAVTNIESSKQAIEKLSLLAAWKDITDAVYSDICPTAINDPISVLQDVRQHVTNAVTNEGETMSVEQYYRTVKACTNFFNQDENWPIDVVQHFITHLVEDLRTTVQSKMNYVTATAPRDAFSQTQKLQEVYAIAIKAEKQNTNINNKIKHQIQGTQAMFTTVNLSIAEKTIQAFTKSPVPKSPSMQKMCWGCGQTDHVYATKTQILCPNKDVEGVREKAELMRADFIERQRKIRRNKRKSDDPSSFQAGSNKKKFATVDDIKAMLSEFAKGNASKVQSDILTLTSILVLSNSTKPQLPMRYDMDLPHINMKIGQENSKSIQLSLAYDTCAALNVGFAGYHLKIAKEFPSLVKSLTWADNKFSPLTLSGIVGSKQDAEAKPSTVLSATIEYFTPYLTSQDTPTTLKIALGNEVGVNTILGVSTIKTAKLSMDLNANVVDPGVLIALPFPISFKPTSRGIPDLSSVEASVTELFAIKQTSMSAWHSTVASCEKFLETGITPVSANIAKSGILKGGDLANTGKKSSDNGVFFDLASNSTCPI